MKPNEQTHTYPGIVINDDFSTEDTTGMQLEYEGITYRVSNINFLLEEEKATLIEGIKNTHNLFVDEYQKFSEIGIDHNTLGIIDILPDKSINISYEISDQEFPTLHAEIGATVNYFDVLLKGDSLNPLEAIPAEVIQDAGGSFDSEEPAAGAAEHNAPDQHQDTEAEGGNNKNSSAEVIQDTDGSFDSEEPAADVAEHNAPEQHQNIKAEGGDNTDAPSFFSTFFSTIGDFFSSVFSSIFSFIFGPDSEEKEEDQQPPQVSELVNSNSGEEEEGGAPNSESDSAKSKAGEELAIAEIPLQVSDPLDSNSQEGEVGQQLPQSGAPNPESDALESEVIEEQVIEEGQQQGQNADVVDDSTFSISSIFSTI
ncbi:MAG: hypothetical protein PG981_000103 [Wolbachia endosymbiont of Ctenocephalides orientis wCori]|nr:MAG: hypothetical protein PG981_000103 [Wolbachia endosymbiont of Ctenocephalides orientis wCori]